MDPPRPVSDPNRPESDRLGVTAGCRCWQGAGMDDTITFGSETVYLGPELAARVAAAADRAGIDREAWVREAVVAHVAAVRAGRDDPDPESDGKDG